MLCLPNDFHEEVMNMTSEKMTGLIELKSEIYQREHVFFQIVEKTDV